LCDVKGFLTPTEVARQLHVSRATMYRMIREGEIGHTRIGGGRGRIFIPKEAVDRYREQRRAEAVQGTRRAEVTRSADGNVINVRIQLPDGFNGTLQVDRDGEISVIIEPAPQP
jgi:excisionase family DNA binding protein